MKEEKKGLKSFFFYENYECVCFTLQVALGRTESSALRRASSIPRLRTQSTTTNIYIYIHTQVQNDFIQQFRGQLHLQSGALRYHLGIPNRYIYMQFLLIPKGLDLCGNSRQLLLVVYLSLGQDVADAINFMELNTFSFIYCKIYL